MYYGLTSLGVIHTAISLVALGAGLYALVRDKQIAGTNTLGKVYVWTTVLTCITGFGIFQHGGFGKPHALGIITLVVLGVAAVAEKTHFYGRASRYVATICYSATVFFHFVPAVTETTTRLPLGKPLLPNADAPELQMAAGVLFLIFLIGSTLQFLRIRAASGAAAKPAKPGFDPLVEDEDVRMQ